MIEVLVDVSFDAGQAAEGGQQWLVSGRSVEQKVEIIGRIDGNGAVLELRNIAGTVPSSWSVRWAIAAQSRRGAGRAHLAWPLIQESSIRTEASDCQLRHTMQDRTGPWRHGERRGLPEAASDKRAHRTSKCRQYGAIELVAQRSTLPASPQANAMLVLPQLNGERKAHATRQQHARAVAYDPTRSFGPCAHSKARSRHPREEKRRVNSQGISTRRCGDKGALVFRDGA